MKINLKKIYLTIISFFVLLVVIGAALYYGFFLRLPDRFAPMDAKLFVSPANGKVIAIIKDPTAQKGIYKNHKKVIDNFTQDIGSGATLVSIMMTPLNVHYQRAPQNSKIIMQQYHTGEFLNAINNSQNMEATFRNEHNIILFQTSDGIKYKVVQIAGTMARRIVSFVQTGQEVTQGEVIGVIKLGSQVSIIFDHNIDVVAQIGQTLIEGESIIGIKKK